MKHLKWIGLCVFGIFFLSGETAYPAHILEPLGTEISATPPRGRMFGQIEYFYSKLDPEIGPEIKSHVLPLEFEIGVGERTQLNLEAAVLLKEEEEGSSASAANGIQEMAFGLKHRFWDETAALPDAAFLVEFAPAAGLKGDEAELKGTLLMTKTLSSRFVLHLESGYLNETEREVEVEGEVIGAGPVVEGEGEVHVKTHNIFIYNVAPVFTLVPDKLLISAELNGETDFKHKVSHVTASPGVIYAMGNTSLKLRVLFGLTDETDDLGVHFGVSRLF